MDLQKIFDTAVTGIRAQGALARTSDGRCRYRTEDGCKCALGHSIPDDRYDPRMENLSPFFFKSLVDYPMHAKIAEALGAESNNDCELLSDLQQCHDHAVNVDGFLENARHFAVNRGLNTKVLDA